jgi:hypothetical protein
MLMLMNTTANSLPSNVISLLCLLRLGNEAGVQVIRYRRTDRPAFLKDDQ